MSEIKSVFELLYSRLLLRDFFGKIIPGFIVLFVGTFVLFLPNNKISDILNFSFWGWLLFIGVAWITGFVIQSLGYLTHIISYEYRERVFKPRLHSWRRSFLYRMTPSNCHVIDKSFRIAQIKEKLLFDKFAGDVEKQQFERTVVIKEATGNGAIAFLICWLLLSFAPLLIKSQEFYLIRFRNSLTFNWLLQYDWHWGFLWLITALLFFLLYCFYRISKTKQYEYLVSVVKFHKKDNYDKLESEYN